MVSERIKYLRALAGQFQAGFDVNFSHVIIDLPAEKAPVVIRRIRDYDRSIVVRRATDDGITRLRLSLGPPRGTGSRS